MHVLLYSPNPNGLQGWVSRLESFETQPIIAVDEAGIEAALAQRSMRTVFVRWEIERNENVDAVCHQLLSQSLWMVALTDGSEFANREAYSRGFHDCIAESCCDSILKSKLSHVGQIENLEQRLTQAQKLESIGELAAGIAHEINTPIQYVGDNTRFIDEACNDLNGVLAQCQSLVELTSTDPNLSRVTEKLRKSMNEADIDYLVEEVPAAIKQTLEGIDRVANIVRAMKEFAHPGVSEMVLTDIAKSIQNTIMVARNEWKYVAEMETEFDSNLPPVPCFPGELNQVLLNMIVNAAHAIGDAIGDASETKGLIRISTQRQRSNAEIRIEDSGSGIDPKHVEKIFNPFFTTKAAGKGTGQGLAIAHSVIVHKHGGRISVESEVGRGTTFIIQIPLVQHKEPDSVPDTTASSAFVSGVPGDEQAALDVTAYANEGTK